MFTKTVIGKKSDAGDSKGSPRFASQLKKMADKISSKPTFDLENSVLYTYTLWGFGKTIMQISVENTTNADTFESK